MPTPDTGTGPGWDSPITQPAAASNPQPGDSQFSSYDQLATAMKATVDSAQKQYNDALTAYQQSNQFYQQLAGAPDQYGLNSSKVADARAARDNDNNNLQRSGAALERAQASAATNLRDFLTNRNLLPGQQELLTAEANNYSNQAALTQAQTAVLNAQDPKAAQAASIALTQAQTAAQGSQAELTKAQTNATSALLPGQVAQQGAETGLTGAQTNLAGAQANLTNVQAAQLPAQSAANIGLTNAQTVQGIASANQSQAAVQSAQQGTLYGLDQYVAQMKDAVAKGLIQPDAGLRALQARVAGTDVNSASQEAQGALNQNYQTSVGQRAQDVGLANQRVSTFGGLAGAGLNTLAGMNANAPAGSQAGAQAFGGMMQALMGAMGGQQGMQTPPPVQQPNLPPFLAQYAGQQPGGGPAASTGGAPWVPPPDASWNTPGPTPAPAAASPTPAASTNGHTITINIGGGSDSTQGAPGGGSMNAANYGGQPIQGPQAMALPGMGQGGGALPMPALVQGMMPASPADVMAAHAQTAQKFGLPWGM